MQALSKIGFGIVKFDDKQLETKAMAQVWTDQQGDNQWMTDGNWDPGPAPNDGGVDAEVTAAGPATIGSGAQVEVGTLMIDTGVSLTVSGILDAGAIVNDGTLAMAGGMVSVWGSAGLTNAGTLTVGAGSTAPAISSNAGGTIDVAGGTVTLGPDWTGEGTIVETAGTLVLTGTYTTAEVLAVQRSGGALILDGTLDNTGATLNLHDIAGATIGGTIKGGTVIGTGADVTWRGQNGPALISGATVQGTVDLGSGYVDLYSIVNQGTITGENSITDVLDGQWDNSAGTVIMTGTPLFLAGSFTTAGFGTITDNLRTYFNGTWDLQGATFDAAAPGSLNYVIDYGGTFENGTIANSQSLNYVYNWDLTRDQFYNVTLEGGLLSNGAYPNFPGNLLIDGGSRVVPAADGTSYLRNLYSAVVVHQDLTVGGVVDSYFGELDIGAGYTFTLAADGTFYGNQFASGGGTFVNDGTILNNKSQQAIYTVFVNHGTVKSVPLYGSNYFGVTLAGPTTNAADGTIDNNGAITGTLINDGLITADHGSLTVANATGAGHFAVTESGTLHLQSGTAQAIDFLAPTGTLVLDDPDAQTGAISMQAGDVVDLANLAWASGATVTTNGDAVTVTAGGVSETVTVTGASNYAFQVAQDATAGTDLSIAACYARGTPISTDRGERAVETLMPGDRVITADGTAEPVRWVAQRSIAGAFIRGNHLVLPVTFKAGSLGQGVPRQNLCVSPGHAMVVDGCLVPAWRLVNGVSVAQAVAVDSVSYHHLELDRHAIIFASGAPAESFLDNGCRGQFQQSLGIPRTHAAPLTPVALRLEDGFALQSMQERLALRAGIPLRAEPVGVIRGYVDAVGPQHACGWAQDTANPEDAVVIEIRVGGQPVLSIPANGFRADLRQAGLGSGCHAFDVVWDGIWDGVVEVRRACGGARLPRADSLPRGDLARAA